MARIASSALLAIAATEVTHGKGNFNLGHHIKLNDTLFAEVETCGPHCDGLLRSDSKTWQKISPSAGCRNVLFSVWRKGRRSCFEDKSASSPPVYFPREGPFLFAFHPSGQNTTSSHSPSYLIIRSCVPCPDLFHCSMYYPLHFSTTDEEKRLYQATTVPCHNPENLTLVKNSESRG